MDKKQLTKLLSFFIMADGGVYINSHNRTVNAQFIMNMKAENKDYIDWVDNTLKVLTGTRQVLREDYNTDGYIRQPQIRLESNTHPFLTILHERIYTDKYKGIDPHALKLLDWEAMAILYMSDGCLTFKKGYWDISLNMKRLSYGDQLLLKESIRDKLKVEFNVNRNGKYYYLRLRNKDRETFLQGVLPFILPSFMYKVRMINPPIVGGGEIVCTMSGDVEVSRND